MTLLALTIKVHTGIRLGEIAELLGVIAGVALLLAGLSPAGRGRTAQIVGGLALAICFVLLIIATHWGHFR